MADAPNTNNTFDGPLDACRVLAIGRLGRDEKIPTQWDPEKHALIAIATSPTLEKKTIKMYKNHMKQIMSKGAQKLVVGGKIKLSGDNDEDVHVLSEQIDDLEGERIIVFFAITSTDFGKYNSINRLFDDMKTTLYRAYPKHSEIWVAKSLNDRISSPLSKLLVRNSSSALSTAQNKVEEVKIVMKENLERAVNTQEKLEEVEEKAQQFEDQANVFYRKSKKLSGIFCRRYWKLMLIIGVVLAAIIAYVGYTIYENTHSHN